MRFWIPQNRAYNIKKNLLKQIKSMQCFFSSITFRFKIDADLLFPRDVELSKLNAHVRVYGEKSFLFAAVTLRETSK